MSLRRVKRHKSSFSGFTLIELLVVMGILGVLMAVTLLVINPTEYFKRARNSTRGTDITNLKQALQLYSVDTGTDLGTPDHIVYVSLPDANANCSSWSLPTLTAPFTYQCATPANYKKADGTGWLPFNFSTGAYKTLAVLPVDPVNNANNYYTFTKGDSSQGISFCVSSIPELAVETTTTIGDVGATWTERTSAGSRNWTSLASSADGTKLAAGVGNGGYIYTSTDSGATWTERTNAGSRDWKAIASSSDGSKLAAGSSGYIYTSTDSGATWTERTSAGSRG